MVGWFKLFRNSDENNSDDKETIREERSFAVGDLCVRVIGDRVKISRLNEPDSFVEVNNDVYEFMKVFSDIQRVVLSSNPDEKQRE